MRILFVNDGVSDVGGVQAYLDAVIGALESRGHDLAIAYCTDSGTIEAGGLSRRLTRFLLTEPNRQETFTTIRRWSPDICFSHNMNDLEVDRTLGQIAPVVKFMHGYFGTCIGGLKMHAFPRAAACDRVFGPACLALYLPRRCGQLSPVVFLNQWQWAGRQRSLFESYSAIVVASEHMRREFVRHGCNPDRVHVNPLFPTNAVDAELSAPPAEPHVVFLGRMTALKGGDLLIRAAQRAAATLRRPIRLTMIGDGPSRADWEAVARNGDVPAAFTGWLRGDDRWPLLRTASVLAIPSVWPEPFGLVGLEAAALGVPAIAIATGGITEWLRPGRNGIAVAPPASSDAFGDALAALLGDRQRLAVLRRGAHRTAKDMTLAAHIDRLEAVLRAVGSTAHPVMVPRFASSC